MRTVFSNSMCAHVYAQQTQPTGRSLNTSFEGDTFRSYQTPVARIVRSRRGGGRVLLLTSTNYSNSTIQHVTHVRRAFGYMNSAFRVPSLGREYGRHVEPKGSTHGVVNHRANLAHLVAAVHDEAKRLKRAVKYTTLDGLVNLGNTATAYARLFGFGEPDFTAVFADLREHAAKREARANTPAAIRKREQSAARRAAEMARVEAVRAECVRVARIENAALLVQWREGQDVRLPWSVQQTETGSAMLRLKPNDLGVVQTSQGAEVPAHEAEVLYRALRAVHAAANDTMVYGQLLGRSIGHFRVVDVRPDGGVTIGCHVIDWSEIEAFAARVGW